MLKLNKLSKSLLPATFIYLISYSLTRFVGFLLLPLYTNILTPEEFGNYSLLMAIYAVLNVLYQAGLLQGFTGFFFNDKYPRNNVVSTTLILLTMICLILAAILTTMAQPLSRLLLSDTKLSGLFILVVWILFIDNISFLGLHLLKTEQKATSVAIFSAIAATINISLNLWFLLQLELGITGIFFAQAASGFVLLSLCLPSLFKYLSSSFSISNIQMFDKTLAAKLLKFSLPFAIAGIFGILMDVADRFLIDSFLSRQEVGLYSFAYKISSLMGIFIIAFRTAYLPYILNKKNPKDLASALREIFNKLLALMSIIFLAVIFFIEDVSYIQVSGNYLFNPDYAPALYLVPLLVMAYLFNGLAAFFSLAPYITGKTKHFIFSDAIGLTVNIVLNLLFIPRYGIAGAALATLAGFVMSTFYLYVFFCFHIKVPFALGRIFVILTGALFATFGAYFTDNIYLKLLILVVYISICLPIIRQRNAS